ncbi:hypothetical protein Adi01nite_30890 [Amorphoplanes digitatis]|uniref:Uncharacterized protein n=1 Tax=Actinoplanes digitatis TaxID=1868 RepID=A0A7W7I2W1_9ACTN|nr:hypothetical protein [Actinoplanes digitatis]BFE75240.1 hypothetical protein GCM10020092_085410 [Actinoplanes digitatis]GID93677.1 hypothetical protein Adi01nite_30890 [Actinoplanes digitatis]
MNLYIEWAISKFVNNPTWGSERPGTARITQDAGQPAHPVMRCTNGRIGTGRIVAQVTPKANGD